MSPSFHNPQIEWMNQLMKYGMKDAVRLCPEAWQQNPMINGGNRLGGAYYAWGPDGAALTDPFTGIKKTGSYGMNGYLYRQAAGTYNRSVEDENLLLNHASGGLGVATAKLRLYKFPVKNTAEIPLVADSTWSNGWPNEFDPVPANLYNTNSFGPMMGRFCMARHQRAVNVGFLDGHVTTVPLFELWTLKWHARWAPTQTQLNTIRTNLRLLK